MHNTKCTIQHATYMYKYLTKAHKKLPPPPCNWHICNWYHFFTKRGLWAGQFFLRTKHRWTPSTICSWCTVSGKWIVGPLFFEQAITVENDPHLLTQFIALPEENKQDCWFQQHWRWPTRLQKQQQLDHQTPSHLTSFYEDFLWKESTAITQDAWMSKT